MGDADVTPTSPGARRQLRAGDHERDAIVTRLHRGAAAGRLGLDELDVRVSAALVARTLGELDDLVADLPPDEPPPPARRRWRWPLSAPLPQMLATDALFVAVWIAAGGGTFWPVWLFIANGFVFLSRVRRKALAPERLRRYDDRLPEGPPKS